MHTIWPAYLQILDTDKINDRLVDLLNEDWEIMYNDLDTNKEYYAGLLIDISREAADLYEQMEDFVTTYRRYGNSWVSFPYRLPSYGDRQYRASRYCWFDAVLRFFDPRKELQMFMDSSIDEEGEDAIQHFKGLNREMQRDLSIWAFGFMEDYFWVTAAADVIFGMLQEMQEHRLEAEYEG